MGHCLTIGTRRLGAAALLLVGLVVGGLTIACGGESDAAAPTPSPTAIELLDGDDGEIVDDFSGARPPDLTVTAGDMSVVASLGSHCYDSLCADAIGYITPAKVLPLEGDSLRATLDSEAIVELFVSATHVEDLESQPVCTVVDGIVPTGPICESKQEQLAWTGDFDAGIEMESTFDAGSVNVDTSTLEPGRYIVSFFLRFETGGDASYGVLLDVP